jgi:hypothetical protein
MSSEETSRTVRAACNPPHPFVCFFEALRMLV